MTLQRTPLYDLHAQLGAKFADFGGWEMPIEYAGTVAEHTAVRESVGIFDVSHMGKIAVHGPHAVDWLNSILANDLARITDGQAQYSMLLNDQGGVVDDLIVYRLSEDGVYIIPNAANAATVVSVLRAAAPPDIQVDDQHLTHGIVAVQGPRSGEVMSSLGLPAELTYMSMQMTRWHNAPVVVCRTGYTGEQGYEIVAPNEVLAELWSALMEHTDSHGLLPAGLGARDTLRTEMGYPLHGQDISPTITPLEASLSWAVGWDKPAFHGRDALVRQKSEGAPRKLRALRAQQRAIPRSHMTVSDSAGQVIGEVTSGTFSPSLKEGIALALLDAGVADGDVVMVDVRGKSVPFAVVRAPFVPAHVRD